MLSLLILGLNHETADITVREGLSFTKEHLYDGLKSISALSSVNEVVILSTCNRTELIVSPVEHDSAKKELLNFLAHKANMKEKKLLPYLYQKENNEAVEHIFKVACGLNSMILGESQIVQQVKHAFEFAITEGKSNKELLNLYRATQNTVKKVRTHTKIAQSAVSVSHSAIELAKKVFGSLEGKKALLVGAGETCELAAKHFQDNGIASIDVTNRTLENAKKLAEKFHGKAFAFSSMYEAMESVDIVLTSTGSQEPVILTTKIRELMKRRENRALFFIDIAVPRDIENSVGSISDVYLFDIDDLQKIVEVNKEKRKKEAIKALEIVQKQVDKYQKGYRIEGVKPVILDLRKYGEEIRKIELEKSMKKLRDCPQEVKDEIERLSSAIVNKFLHHPIRELKNMAVQSPQKNWLYFFKSIFKLE